MTVISEMSAEKRNRNIVPEGVVMQDLQCRVISDIKTAITELCREKVIIHNKTLNSVAFKLTPEQER